MIDMLKKRRKKRKNKQTKRKAKSVGNIPSRIVEIINYLSTVFSNKLMEKEDLKQDLYLLYLSMLKNDKRAKNAKPGYFFLRFKWYLLTKYKREINRKKKEWEYVQQFNPNKTRDQSKIGYINPIRNTKRK